MGMGYASPANELRRQATTAAGSATGQHLPAICGCHARTKSMIALPFENAWLKCTLHGGYLLFRKSVTTQWDRVRYQCGVRLYGCRCKDTIAPGTPWGARIIGGVKRYGKRVMGQYPAQPSRH